jgi:hypothetical protein
LDPALIPSLDRARSQHGSMGEFGPDRGASERGLDGRRVDSTIGIKIVDPLSDLDWDRLAISHPDSNFFHSTAWAKVLWKTYKHKPVYLHFYRQSELLALVPVMEIRSRFTGCRGVCLPFSDFCGPLVFNRSESNGVIGELAELARRQNWRYIEVRGGREALPVAATPAVQFCSHTLSLPDRTMAAIRQRDAPRHSQSREKRAKCRGR